MGARARRPMNGEDERADLQLDFLEAVFGCQKEIDVSRLTECGTCNGSGTEPNTTPYTCSTCGGTGQVVTAAQVGAGCSVAGQGTCLVR